MRSFVQAAAMAAGPDWEMCRAVAREHGRTFYFASHFLPPKRQRAILAAYAFCRIADDIVDRAAATGPAAAERSLAVWEAELDTPRHPVGVAFARVRADYAIPDEPVRDLIAGVRMDLAPHRYETWADLEHYCYRVAGTVGLIAAPILGCHDRAALPHAVDLGIAMQLTNILRDVAEDARMGRLYLPLADLAAFGCDPAEILAGQPGERFPELIAFEIARARALYEGAHCGVRALSPTGRLTALASAHLYGQILTRIEEQRHDVFAGRASIPTVRKLRTMPVVLGAFLNYYLPEPMRTRG
jgi:phytoene synthase